MALATFRGSFRLKLNNLFRSFTVKVEIILMTTLIPLTDYQREFLLDIMPWIFREAKWYCSPKVATP